MRQAAPTQTPRCLPNAIIATNKPIHTLEQAKNQLNLTQDIGIQSSERKSTQLTGTSELPSQDNYQTIVFLPGPHSPDEFPNSVEPTSSAPNELVITDTGQTWLVSDESISFLDDLLAAPIELLPQSAYLGELNTPTIEKQKGFDFNRHQAQANVSTFDKFTENKNQLKGAELPPAENTETSTINNNQSGVNAEEEAAAFCHNSIRDLIQDDQMFRLDSDPSFFDSMNVEDNLNNIIGLEQYTDLGSISDGWMPATAELEFYSQLPDALFEGEIMEKKEDSATASSPSPSPLPAPPSPMIVEGEIKSENPSFDLINFIIFGKNDDFLTPMEEKPQPSFEQQVTNVIKTEPEPSTSTTLSPTPEIRPARRRAPKRRYSSDSDFSVATTASSFNATSNRSLKKKRGRPAKELITNLPTINDFSHMPIERASHLVLRIKNNEASRKSRMKSKSKQTKMEDQCDQLVNRQRRLRAKRNKLESQIEVLRRWLLGQN